jgi:3-isopropylmalate/(R)-2-methylmalate dehydratase large subunit
MSMDGRMTVCNMSIEYGARAGVIAPDDTTYAYVRGRPYAPNGDDWDACVDDWQSLRTDDGAAFDDVIEIDGARLEPTATWGTTPAQSAPLSGVVPDPASFADADARCTVERALTYMDLEPGTAMSSIAIDSVFIGSCSNSRIDDLREAAAVLRGRRVSDRVRLLVVPGSTLVARQAKEEGILDVLAAAGAEVGLPGCSLCVAVNGDELAPAERCASTSNRNFEGRQGNGARTHLVSPAVAAATAVAGRLCGPEGL